MLGKFRALLQTSFPKFSIPQIRTGADRIEMGAQFNRIRSGVGDGAKAAGRCAASIGGQAR